MLTDPADMAMPDLLAHLRSSRVMGRYFTPDGCLVDVRGGDGPDDGGSDDGADDKGGKDDDGQKDDKPNGSDADPAAEASKWKALARKHEERAKANATAAKDLDKLQKATASDQERAVIEAKEAGKAEAMGSVGSKLVDAEFRAAAAGRLDDRQRTALIDGLDRSKFLTDDGDVDTDKVAALIEGIAGPKSDKDDKTPFPGLGQGKRPVGDAAPSVAAGKDLFAERTKKK